MIVAEDLKDRVVCLLGSIQFANGGYCPACGGWDADQRQPRRGCTPGFHKEDCELIAVLKQFEGNY